MPYTQDLPANRLLHYELFRTLRAYLSIMNVLGAVNKGYPFFGPFLTYLTISDLGGPTLKKDIRLGKLPP